MDTGETPFAIGEMVVRGNGIKEEPPRRWNLGAGPSPIEGYRNIDRQTGQEAYPLDCPDEYLDEIRASHILEHFSHREVTTVLAHWISKLKPGGLLKVSVPDFLILARRYLDGEILPIQEVIMGAHSHPDDYHKAIFDRETLEEVFLGLGLERVGPWASDYPDDSGYDFSLNICGYKPTGAEKPPLGKVYAVLSCPRFGPLMHSRCASHAFHQLGVRYTMGSGAYWHQILSNQIEMLLQEDPKPEWILTLDYDTAFEAADVLSLYRLARGMNADCVFALETKRGGAAPLFRREKNGQPLTQIALAELGRNLLPVSYGHFGLTLFKASALASLPKPWFRETPDKNGEWHEGKIDHDIGFWQHWRECGKSLFLAPRIAIGHLQEMITWPGPDLKPVYQTVQDYEEVGRPAEVLRV